MKYYLITVFFLSSFITLKAQNTLPKVEDVSTTELLDMLKKAKESGLTDEQIEALALTKGYTASDIAKVKAKLLPQTGKDSISESDSTDSEEISPKNKRKKELSPEELKKQKLRDGIYGLNIFNKEVADFNPNLKIPIPKNYILGTDDVISIDISGYAMAHYEAKLKTDGTIKIENLSPITVSGLTLDQAEEKIIQRLKSLFGGLSQNGALTADVSLNKIRAIRVNVIGEAVFPGTYTIPSLATAFNLLVEAGGPTEIGSMRNIEIFRNGKLLKKLDVYDYLLNGIFKENIVLQDQDILHIPYVKSSVIVNGQVRNPKIYELDETESLKQILSYAGGFNELAYQKNVRIDRNSEIGKRVLTIDQTQYPLFKVQKGDLIMVDSLSSLEENMVFIAGSIKKPGKYGLDKAKTIKDLIILAEGLKPEALAERILITRKDENYHNQILDINYLQVLSGSISNLELFNQDSILVINKNDLNLGLQIQVDGEVNTPIFIPFAENLTVSKAILFAGGLKDGANASRIEIARRINKDDFTEDKTVQILNLKVHPNLLASDLDNNFILEPFDRIFVRKMSQYENQKQVSITGEIPYPGPYTLEDKKERISELIERAGGLRNQADLGAAKFTRGGKAIGIDLNVIFKNKENPNNILLQSGDALEIPRKNTVVSISGQVYNPTTIPFEGNKNLNYYLDIAGGTTDSAYVRKTYVKYANGRFDRTKSFLGIKIYPKVESGSEIIVPLVRKTRLSPAERIAMFTSITSIASVLATILFRVL